MPIPCVPYLAAWPSSTLPCHNCDAPTPKPWFTCRLWLSQHSDWAHSGARADLSVQEGLQGEAREELLDLLALGRNASFQKDRSALVVCHSPPGKV